DVFCFQAEDGIRDRNVTGVQTCALPISYGPVCLTSCHLSSPGPAERYLPGRRRRSCSELFADGAQGFFAYRTGQAGDVELAVQVVVFVLQAARHQTFAFHLNRVPLQVGAFHPCVVGPRGRVPQAGYGQASFVTVLELFGHLDQLRVEHVSHLALDVPGESPQVHPDLVRRQTGPAFGVDRLHQVPDQGAHRVVDAGD